MKKLTLDQWEEKYIVGPVARFDQKYTMFNRPSWDLEIQGLLDDWSFTGEVKDKPGFTRWEQALSRASSRATQLSIFNIHKPNPNPVAMDIIRSMVRTESSSPQITKPRRKDRRIIVADPQTVTRNVKKVARYFGADLVGVCRLDQRWVYSHTYGSSAFESTAASGEMTAESKPQEIPEQIQYAVVMGFEMEYDMIKYYPSYIADTATGMGYSRMAIANAQLSAFIRGLGFETVDCSINDVALSIPLALLAGLGDLGRNGLLITPQFGPRLRLSKVLTDLPLVPDAPIDFGVTEFCTVCKKCTELCPSHAIMSGERTAQARTASNVAGELKWPLQAEKCRMYWAQANKPCSTCIACCPYNKPNSMFHRTVRWFTDNARWADLFYIWADNLFGYGRPVKAEDFWHEWQSRRNQTPL